MAALAPVPEAAHNLVYGRPRQLGSFREGAGVMSDRTRFRALLLVIAFGLLLALTASMLVGCEGADDPSEPPPAAEKPKEELNQAADEPPAMPEPSNREETYYLTFAGTPPAPMDFEIVNKTPVKEKDGHYYARKSFSFVPANTDGEGTDLWIFDATLGSDDKLTGTATYKRSMSWTGNKSVTTWTGEITGGLDKELRLKGEVDGTQSSKSNGTSHSYQLSWSFTER